MLPVPTAFVKIDSRNHTKYLYYIIILDFDQMLELVSAHAGFVCLCTRPEKDQIL